MVRDVEVDHAVRGDLAGFDLGVDRAQLHRAAASPACDGWSHCSLAIGQPLCSVSAY